MNGVADVDFHNPDDDGVENSEEHVEHGVHQPVNEDVAGETHAETAAEKKITIHHYNA